MGKIKTTKLSEPTRKTIEVICPGCNTQISRTVAFFRKQGEEQCGLCGTKFKWEEE